MQLPGEICQPKLLNGSGGIGVYDGLY